MVAYIWKEEIPHRKEKHSNFQKGREIKEMKVEFLQHIEFLGG